MHNKFLGTGEHGYNPWRKIKICLAGMRYAIRYDFSVSLESVTAKSDKSP